MMGHYSVKQTEEYAITEQESISKEMSQLKEKLSKNDKSSLEINPMDLLLKIQEEIQELSAMGNRRTEAPQSSHLSEITKQLDSIKKMILVNSQIYEN